MDSLVLEKSRSRGLARSPDWGNQAAPVFLGLFLIAFAFVRIGDWTGAPALLNAKWAETALLGLTGASTLVSLARQFPWQNVLLGTVLIAISAAAIEVMLFSNGSLTSPALGLLGQLSQLSLVWVVAILNCRGVIRLVLRPWRFAPNYGFWLLGGTVVLTVLFLLSFTTMWQLPVESWSSGTVFGCAIGALITIGMVTPIFINKKPVSERVNWHPLVVWVAFNLWFVGAAIGRGRWSLCGIAVSEFCAVGLLLGLASGSVGWRRRIRSE